MTDSGTSSTGRGVEIDLRFGYRFRPGHQDASTPPEGDTPEAGGTTCPAQPVNRINTTAIIKSLTVNIRGKQ